MKLHCYCSVAALLVSVALAGATNDRYYKSLDFDFFYHVQQWPASFCDTKFGCCFPGNEKPEADFGIHGLWPNYAVCRTAEDAGRPLNQSNTASALALVPLRRRRCRDLIKTNGRRVRAQIRDLESDLLRNWGTLSCKNKESTAFWSHEWTRHGTCSGMDQHAYFRAALEFKARFNLTRILLDAGIVPSDEKEYFLSSIRDAVAEATGSAPNLECNRNERNETQLFQVYQCVGLDGSSPVRCPMPLPMDGGCTDTVKFPAF
ncbi:hypothetical protein EJB05_10968, partial [Eragrostis curvula]